MQHRTIPRTDIRISIVGFGCWTMGGPNYSSANGQPIGWADVNEDDVLQGVKAGLDAGVNHWDNADIYGNGKAERMLGWALRTLGVNLKEQVIATKVGHFRGTALHAYEPAHIRRQCEQSLRNLGVETIDLYYFHHASYIGTNYAGNAHDYLHEAAETMHALVKEGKVRAIGQSAYAQEDFARAIPVLQPHVLQAKANLRYDEFIRPDSPLHALMRAHGCGFIAYGPLDQGILLDKFNPDKPPAFEPGDYRAGRKDFAPATLRRVRQKLASARASFSLGTTAQTAEDVRALSSLAQRWILAHDNVLCAIPGFRNRAQAEANIAHADQPAMSSADVLALRELFRAP